MESNDKGEVVQQRRLVAELAKDWKSLTEEQKKVCVFITLHLEAPISNHNFNKALSILWSAIKVLVSLFGKVCSFV